MANSTMPRFSPRESRLNVSKMDSVTKAKSDHRYGALRNVNDHSDSDTDVESWEDDDGVQPRQRRRRVWRTMKRYRWVVDTTLLLIIVGMLVERRTSLQKGHRYELAGDISGFAPSCAGSCSSLKATVLTFPVSQQIVSFKHDPVFTPENASDFWNEDTQQAWLSIVPEGLGYVEIKDAGRYSNLPHPIHDYTRQTVFTTSMTHQLHCLYTILEAYDTLQVSMDLGLANQVKMPWHINHCFDYIRQAIMCAGDVALEGAATSFPGDAVTGEDRGGSDGWDARHVCKDYSQVYAYLERETINHVKWISSED